MSTPWRWPTRERTDRIGHDAAAMRKEGADLGERLAVAIIVLAILLLVFLAGVTAGRMT